MFKILFNNIYYCIYKFGGVADESKSNISLFRM